MERHLGDMLRHADLALRAALDRALAELELTAPQFGVLYRLREAPGSSSAELARQAFVSAQTMQAIVVGLEQRTLLERQARPDHGRVLAARLTKRGQVLLARADTRVQATIDRMTAGLDDGRRNCLLDLLQHCIDALDIPTEDLQPVRATRQPRS